MLARLQNKMFYYFLPDGAISSDLAYKANPHFIPVFCIL